MLPLGTLSIPVMPAHQERRNGTRGTGGSAHSPKSASQLAALTYLDLFFSLLWTAKPDLALARYGKRSTKYIPTYLVT